MSNSQSVLRLVRRDAVDRVKVTVDLKSNSHPRRRWLRQQDGHVAPYITGDATAPPGRLTYGAD